MIASYLRVSTEEKQTGQSIESQKYAIKKYAKDNGITIDEYYEDSGWSGALIARPSLDKLREAIKSKQVESVLIYHPDRLSRKQSFQFLLLDEFEKAGVKIIFTALPDFFEGSKESLIVNKSIFSMIAELERTRIAERFRLGKLRKTSEGHIMSSRAPYGYVFITGKHTFEFHPQEIEIVKMILNWGLEARSDNEIIQLLFEKGIKTRTGNIKWAKSTIHKILDTNLSVYAGNWHFNKYRQAVSSRTTNNQKYKHSEKTSRVLNSKADWITVKLPKRLAIITQEQADRIRKIKHDNRSTKKGNIKNEYLLQGRIFCTNCAGLCYSDTFHGVPYYRCGDRQRSAPFPPKCTSRSIKSKKLEFEVWQRLVELMTDPDLVKKAVSDFVGRNNGDVVKDGTKVELLKKKMLLQKEREKLAEGYLKGFIDDATMKSHTLRLKRETELFNIEEAEEVRKSDIASSLDISNIDENLNTLVGEMKEVINTSDFPTRRKILEMLSVSVNYCDGEYSLKGAFSIPTIDAPKPHIMNL